MAAKIVKICLLLAMLASSICYGANESKGEPRQVYTQAQYFKNYALTACLGDGLGAISEKVKIETADVEGAYLELGSFYIESYQEAVELGRTFLAKKYKNKHWKKLTIMKCIDFFHSDELEQLTQRSIKKIDAAIAKEKPKHH
jgi:hypothetical protein